MSNSSSDQIHWQGTWRFSVGKSPATRVSLTVTMVFRRNAPFEFRRSIRGADVVNKSPRRDRRRGLAGFSQGLQRILQRAWRPAIVQSNALADTGSDTKSVGGKLDYFNEFRRKYDPTDRMLNDFIAGFFGTPQSQTPQRPRHQQQRLKFTDANRSIRFDPDICRRDLHRTCRSLRPTQRRGSVQFLH